jgi:predicted enzyme related to lactoylglutathione lyase
MIGTAQPKVLAAFYEKVFGKPADMVEGDGAWHGWLVGKTFFSVGEHSEVKGGAKEPQRLIVNFETKEVKEEFARIKALGATVIKEPYEMSAEGGSVSDGQGAWIATFADPDGNYFQLMTPWEAAK